MSKSLVALLLAAAAVFAGVWYFAGGRESPLTGDSTAHPPVAQNESPVAGSAPAVPAAATPIDSRGRPMPSDPRLAALMVTPEDALIEYVKAPDGRVIAELDNDPNSPRFRKPVREYTYAGGQVAALTAYRYVGEQVEIVRVSVSYDPTGAIDGYKETLDHEPVARQD